MAIFRNVILYGVLRKNFGKRFRFLLENGTAAEAIHALSSQIAGFQTFLAQSKQMGLGFSIFSGKKNFSQNEINTRFCDDDIRIAPIVIGNKNSGLFNIILGAVLIGISLIPSVGTITASYLLSSGIAFGANGLIQLLSPQPKGLKLADRPDNQPSYVFNGAVNTQAQGNPVPLLYGRMIVGSAVISAGINAEDYAPATAGVGAGTNLAGRSLKTPYDQFEA